MSISVPSLRRARSAALALSLVGSAAAHAAGSYTFVDLGERTVGHGMNPNGDVAATLHENTRQSQAAVWHAATGTWTELRHGWEAVAVNRSGGAVGSDSMHETLDVAIRWSPAGFPTVLPAAGSVSEANGIDDAGTVYGGYYEPADGLYHAVTWAGATRTDLGCVDGFQCTAITGNRHGVIAGDVLEINGPGRWPALVQDGQWTILPTPGNCGSMHAVNARSHVVGDACQVSTTYDVWHGFLWKNGTLHDLGSTRKDWISSAFAVNAQDVVAGMVQQPGAISHAAIWEAGTWTRLEDVTAGAAGYFFWNAVGIDDAGRVLVNTTAPDGLSHALVLTPAAAR
jgi:uncharacterized membrane protein